jgi:hypothetical protein
MSTATIAPRTAKKARSFRIQFIISDEVYQVSPLKPDPEVASKAYRFIKRAPDGRITANYDVHLNDHGPQCECKGYLRWKKPCKHILTLIAAGMLPLIPSPTPSPTPLPESPPSPEA